MSTIRTNPRTNVKANSRSNLRPNINEVYLNRIETSVPANEGHRKFISFMPKLIRDERHLKVLTRLASKCQIDKRHTVIKPSPLEDRLDAEGMFVTGKFASTTVRMKKYREEALPLASLAVEKLLARENKDEVTHLIVTSCTGFYAPGLDLELQRKFDLRSDLERTVIGFMGCYAAFNGLKAAYHIVRSEPSARVMLVNLELCSLHLQDTNEPEQILAFMQFADGCAASLISAEKHGLRLDRFACEVATEARDLICWNVGDQGFDMVLSTDVPKAIGTYLPDFMPKILSPEERARTEIWAIHPGGRAVLDAVQERLGLGDEVMAPSRKILREYGNMSSATIMFVLKEILENQRAVGDGLAMAFGPGLTVETMKFHREAQ